LHILETKPIPNILVEFLLMRLNYDKNLLKKCQQKYFNEKLRNSAQQTKYIQYNVTYKWFHLIIHIYSFYLL